MLRLSALFAASSRIGVVVRWTPHKGYGFLKDKASGQDFLVHYRDIVIEDDTGDIHGRGLVQGTEVRFDPSIHNGKTQARNIRSVNDTPLPRFGNGKPMGPRDVVPFNRGAGGVGASNNNNIGGFGSASSSPAAGAQSSNNRFGGGHQHGNSRAGFGLAGLPKTAAVGVYSGFGGQGGIVEVPVSAAGNDDGYHETHNYDDQQHHGRANTMPSSPQPPHHPHHQQSPAAPAAPDPWGRSSYVPPTQQTRPQQQQAQQGQYNPQQQRMPHPHQQGGPMTGQHHTYQQQQQYRQPMNPQQQQQQQQVGWRNPIDEQQQVFQAYHQGQQQQQYQQGGGGGGGWGGGPNYNNGGGKNNPRQYQHQSEICANGLPRFGGVKNKRGANGGPRRPF